MSGHPLLRRGPWRLTDLAAVPPNGLRVFSCFHGGGGSTMGWKLAGYDVVGGVEIDPGMMAVYRANHRPRRSYLAGVGDFVREHGARPPDDLRGIDVLDGSPPCSTFSTFGLRDKAWGVAKHFREGQAPQVLDDLFGQFVQVAAVLRPAVVVAENVKGMLKGNAKGFVVEIFRMFEDIGYSVRLHLLNAAVMGVPQRRERVFFVALRDGGAPPRFAFAEHPVGCAEAFRGLGPQTGTRVSALEAKKWAEAGMGRNYCAYNGTYTGRTRVHPARPANTLTASDNLRHWREPRGLSAMENTRLQTFPDDYDYGRMKAGYVCGMSVPPFMMSRVALEVCRQVWPERHAAQLSACAAPAAAAGA